MKNESILNNINTDTQGIAAESDNLAKYQSAINFIKKFMPQSVGTTSADPDFKPCEPLTLPPDGELKEPPCVVKFSERVFSIGDISCIIGAAKSRKTLFSSVLAQYFLKGYNDSSNEIITTQTGGDLLYIDTEQSTYHAQRTLKNIIATCEKEQAAKLHFYAMREYDRFSRLLHLVLSVDEIRPTLVIIDGISDMMTDTNNLEESMQIISLLMAISKEYQCHITSILHTNNSDARTKGRGHIGSELERKCESVILVRKNENLQDTSSVEAYATRNRTFATMNIKHGINGEPVLTMLNTMNSESTFDAVKDKLKDTFSDFDSYTFKQLYPVILQVYTENSGTITEKKCRKLIDDWVSSGKLEAIKAERNGKKYKISDEI